MDDILGQSQAIERLQSALRTGRLHHAYIFHGPAGVGKFTTALEFGRIVLCHQRQVVRDQTVAACGTCDSCRRLRNREDPSHPDLHIVTKELARYNDLKVIRERKLTSIPVEVLRDALLGPIQRRSQLEHNKLFIVDEAELLNPYGQNALLKTLEEPPEGTFLILVTANEDKLLPTVRSRCQRVAFAALPDQVVSDWLSARSEGLSQEQRDLLIAFADGSLGWVGLALEYDLTQWAANVLPAIGSMAEGRYPTELGAAMAGLIDGFAKRWVDAHENASKDAANRQGSALMWRLIGRHARQQLAQGATQCDADDPVRTEKVLEPWLAVIDALRAAEEEIASNVNLGLVTDHLVSMMFRALTGQTMAV